MTKIKLFLLLQSQLLFIGSFSQVQSYDAISDESFNQLSLGCDNFLDDRPFGWF